MSIQTKDALIQMQDSIELYKFTSSANEFRYTSYCEDVTYQNEIYEAVPIQRSEFTTDLIRGTLTCHIQAPVADLFSQYVVSSPISQTIVEIRRLYADNFSESLLRFRGRILSISISNNTADAECISSVGELDQKIPRVFAQAYCNNSLFGASCAVNRGLWSYPITVLYGINHRVLISPVIGMYVDNWFRYGILFSSQTNESRYITSHIGDTIILQSEINGMTNGSAAVANPGCDKNPETCLNKFNNLENFVGMPYISKGRNPSQWSIGSLD